MIRLEQAEKQYKNFHLDCSMEVQEGMVTGLIGPNGAGKSTTFRLLTGLAKPEAGRVEIFGKEISELMAEDRRKIGVVWSDAGFSGYLMGKDLIAVLKNMYPAFDEGWFQKKCEEFHLPMDKKLKDFSTGMKAKLKVLSAVANGDARLLILDEPTAALTRNESEKLYTLVDKLKENGVSIIFISHRFEDMYRLASRVTVFRDSQYIGTYDVNGITNADLIKAMVGREINDLFPKPEVKLGDEMLRIEHLSRTGFFKDVSFNVRAGEIVGLTGLVGAGRTEVMEAVSGITHPDEGKVFLEGKEVYIKTPSEAMEKGIILLPEDRQKQGLVMSWGLGRNVTLPIISKYAKSGFNDEKAERELSKKLLEEVDTKAVDIFQPASSLSGGNQQKVVVAKALAQEMKVVIMDEPTKGVDVGAKAEIYAIMGDLAKKGYAIILISSEMPEILGMSDRIIVMCNGRKTGELNRGEATQEGILELSMEKSTGKGTK